MPKHEKVAILLCYAAGAHALAVPGRAGVARASLSASDLADTKAKLRKWATKKRDVDDAALELLESLGAADSSDAPLLGRFEVISCDALKAALKAARTPMQDCIVLIDEAGSVTLEAESFVAACAVGIRFRGAVSAHEAERRLKFSAVEFFEPTEEWGISRGLAKCEEALRPLAPSAGGVELAPLRVRFADEDMCVLHGDGELGYVVLSRALGTDQTSTQGATFPFWAEA